MCQKLQVKIQLGLEKFFGMWADLVVKRTCIIFWCFVVFFLIFAAGIQFQEFEEEQDRLWTPAGNPTIEAMDKADVLFPQEEKRTAISITFVAKGDNVLTANILKEMAQFESLLDETTEYDDTDLVGALFPSLDRKNKGTLIKYSDMCLQSTYRLGDETFRKKCYNTESPLDFFYDRTTDDYNLEGLTDQDVIDQIRTGHGQTIYMGENVIYLSKFVGQPNPDPLFQGSKTYTALPLGENNIIGAKAVTLSYIIDNKRVDPNDDKEGLFAGFEDHLQETFSTYSTTLKDCDAYLYTNWGLMKALVSDVETDFGLIFFAIFLVALYTCFFLGSFSPIYCRCLVALCGLLGVFFAYLAGAGLFAYAGVKGSTLDTLMMFLLIGIGVDDMFVLCNSLDQTDYKKDTAERIHETISHAGPAITTTSLTNALAFAFGGISSLSALKNFCLLASLCVIFLYIFVNSVFLAVVVWDTRRIEAKRGECCGACACGEQTIICCKGTFTSPKQRDHTGQPTPPESLKKLEEDIAKADEALKTALRSSGTERCLGKYYAPLVISKWGRIVFLVIYLIWTGVAIYGFATISMYFDQNDMIDEDSPVRAYLDASEDYFSKGAAPINIYTESATLDFSSLENQQKLIAFNTAFESCDGCSKDWIEPETMNSWYRTMQKQVAQGDCPQIPRYEQGVSSTDTPIDPQHFAACLDDFLADERNENFVSSIVRREDLTIKGFKQSVRPNKITDQASDGPDFNDDLRKIIDNKGIGDTYIESRDMLSFELYAVLLREAAVSVSLALIAVFFVVLFITASVPITLLVVMAVVLVDIYLLALINFWGGAFESTVVVFLVIGMGLSVDFSTHIAHTYLVTDAPKSLQTDSERRMYKAKVALSSMGSSVVHCGISTFLSVIVLANAKFYSFIIFFRIWFGLIVFGMSNGFILLPVILSLVGPLPKLEEKKAEQERRASRRLSMKPGQLAQLAALAEKSQKDINKTEAEQGPAPTNQPRTQADFTEQKPDAEEAGVQKPDAEEAGVQQPTGGQQQ